MKSQANSKNQGEGDVDAARRYNQRQKDFVKDGRVTDAAEQAAPSNADDAREIAHAEEVGRSRAKGEDPTVPGANSNRGKPPRKR